MLETIVIGLLKSPPVLMLDTSQLILQIEHGSGHFDTFILGEIIEKIC